MRVRPHGSNEVRAGRALGAWALGLETGYLASVMTATPSVLSVGERLMAWYSGDSYQGVGSSIGGKPEHNSDLPG
ncbi:MAG TPA: hypothetical protein VLW50_33335 [Streptosporangiaceae bacterium]|nr:hypothetical protein [Streptosporangiaceae bacterium]